MDYTTLFSGSYSGPQIPQNTILILPEKQEEGIVLKVIDSNQTVSYVIDPAFNGVETALAAAGLIESD